MNACAQPSVRTLERASATERLAAYVRLFRPANLVTACSDVIAGWVIVGAPENSLFWRLCASAGLYAAGVVLNDVFDRDLDAEERPERPIPCGLVSIEIAAALGAFLIIGAVVCGFCASTLTGFLCGFIAILVLAYDAGLKHRACGPLLMGSCRAMNLMLGLAAVPSLVGDTWYLTLVPLLYVYGITVLSRDEARGGDRRRIKAAMLLEAGAITGLVALSASRFIFFVSALPFIALILMVSIPLWHAYRLLTAPLIQKAVHAGIVSLVVLDAALTASYAGIAPAAAILSLALIAGELSKVFPVT